MEKKMRCCLQESSRFLAAPAEKIIFLSSANIHKDEGWEPSAAEPSLSLAVGMLEEVVKNVQIFPLRIGFSLLF